MERRTVLKGLGVMGVAGAVPGVAGAALRTITGRPFIQPTELVSSRGVLNFTTAVRYGTYDLYGNKVHLRGFDGQPTGKTLRVKAGDRLHFSMINALPGCTTCQASQVTKEASAMTVEAMQAMHSGHGAAQSAKGGKKAQVVGPTVSNTAFNTTNLHVHGVHVSPRQPSDDVLMQIDPGSFYHYKYDIPADHPPGTYFYHPHFHSAVAVQVGSGMGGALIIEGELDRIPEIAAAAEKVMVFQSPAFDAQGVLESTNTLFAKSYPLTVNGLLQPVLTMRPGEVQRWRMVNTTYERSVTLSLLPKGGTTALPFTVLCTDGNALAKATAVPSLYLAAGNRIDALVQAPVTPGTYELRYVNVSESGKTSLLAMTVKVEGVPKTMPLYAGALPQVPLLKPIADSEIVRKRTVIYGFDKTTQLFTVDGVTFGQGQPQQNVVLGTAEEWTVTDTTGFPHSFHIHVNPFQPVSSPAQPMIQPGQWMDTLEVPPNSSITFRTRFADYTGTFVLHCHFLPHEDAGLMQVVNVLPPPLK